MKIDLTGRVMVITGAGTGIGAATAIACAQAGMNLVLAGRRVDRLEKIAHQVRSLACQALVVPCDVTRDADVQSLMDKTQQAFPRIDAVFANAGYGLYASVLQTTDDQYRQIFETNFYGTLRVLKIAASIMLKQPPKPLGKRQLKGHLLICSSAASEVSPPMYGAYAATKAAQDSIGQSLRAELADDLIAVTTVHPGPTQTEFFDRLKETAPPDRVVVHSPSPFNQTSDQVANAILKSLARPIPEVWPHKPTRFGAGLATMIPGFTAAALAHHMRKLRKLEAKASSPSVNS